MAVSNLPCDSPVINFIFLSIGGQVLTSVTNFPLGLCCIYVQLESCIFCSVVMLIMMLCWFRHLPKMMVSSNYKE